ncbi:MAG: hypothetical protein FJX64_11025 [Alphaproteobacteria bacterium]|nr:hypothetical protein [Alphaproteobacteria bacterium]
MISATMLRRPLSAAMRRQAYVLVALLALLMPALLPYGSQPVAALGSYIAPPQPHRRGDRRCPPPPQRRR